MIISGLITVEKQDLVTINRTNAQGRKIREQTPVVECLIRKGRTAPLSLDSKHRVLIYGERALETLAFTDTSGNCPLAVTVYGWLRSNWQEEIVLSVIIVSQIVFHVSAGLRTVAVSKLAAMRNGDYLTDQYDQEHCKSRLSASGFSSRANSVLLDGLFTLKESCMAKLNQDFQYALLTGVIQTGRDRSSDLHPIAAYGELAQEVHGFAATAGQTFQATVQGWLRNSWQTGNQQIASDVVAEQVIIHK